MVHEPSALPTIQERYGRLISDSLPCPGISFATFLYQAKGLPRFYWESEREQIAFAGCGTAIELTAWGDSRFESIETQAKQLFGEEALLNYDQPLAVPRLFGGFSFRGDFVPDYAWTDFTPAHFVLPHFQLIKAGDETWLSINAHIPIDDNPDELRGELRAALLERITSLQQAEQQPTLIREQQPTALNYPMPFNVWESNLFSAIDQIRSGELNKVVLSRVAEVRFDERINVDAALDYLAEHYAECYRFLFEPRPYHAFYGATPELLASVEDIQIRSMGLAGSIRRGTTTEHDNDYANKLLSDPKERYEHQLVVDELKRRLQSVTDELNIAETGLYKLSNIQHLYTPIEGKLKSNMGIIPLVELLHPTPALGGDPRDLAMEVIRQAEPVPRGWYAAPVGYIDHNLNGQFAVAIRSAVVQEKRVWMYAGAGIVKDSIPQKEWDETALKFRPMLNALGIKNDV